MIPLHLLEFKSRSWSKARYWYMPWSWSRTIGRYRSYSRRGTKAKYSHRSMYSSKSGNK